MDFFKPEIEGLVVFTPTVFQDNRGYFFESYNARVWKEAGLDITFVQDNESFSTQNTLRGLHFQRPPFAQAKLVRVLEGAVWDVAVDLRANSPTFGKWYGVELSGKNKIKEIVELAKKKHVAIRVGANSGSVNKEIDELDIPLAHKLVLSVKQQVKILEKYDFHNIVISLKASNIK